MGLVWRLRWSFVHMELIVDECGQGHNLQNNNDMIRPLPTESFSLNNTAIII